MKIRSAFLTFFRYIFLVIIAFPDISLFYLVFTPLTIYPVFGILSLFYSGVSMAGTFLVFGDYAIQIIPACIAGSAYYLLLILNMATPMKIKTRIFSLMFLIFSFLVLNIIRLAVFSSLLFSGCGDFGIVHKAVWYFGSTIFVVLLWFLNVYLFKIKSIPAYTDITNLFSIIKKKRRKR